MMTSKVHITECSWTDRTSHPHRRCRVEIDETTARCWRNSESGYQLVAELARVNADHEFDLRSLPELFADKMRDLAECEQKTRRGEPIGTLYEDPFEGETLEERLARVDEEFGPRKLAYFDRLPGDMTDTEIVVSIAEYSAECMSDDQMGSEPAREWSADDTSTITWELGREPTAAELETAMGAYRARAADLWTRKVASRTKRRLPLRR